MLLNASENLFIPPARSLELMVALVISLVGTPQAIRLFTAIGAGLVALAAAARLLHIRQFDDAVATVKARLASAPRLRMNRL